MGAGGRIEPGGASLRLTFEVGHAVSIPEKLARILAVAAAALAERQQIDGFGKFTSELRTLKWAFPKDMKIAWWYAETLSIGLEAYRKSEKADGMEAVLDQARDLATTVEWSQEFRAGAFQLTEPDRDIPISLAPAEKHLEKMLALARAEGSFARDQERQLLKTLLGMTGGAAMLYADRGDQEKFAKRLGDLRAMREVLPGQTAVARLLAMALGKRVQSATLDRRDAGEAERLFEELANLESEAGRDAFVAEIIVKGAALMITAYAKEQPVEKLDSWVALTRRLAESHSEQSSVAVWAGKALANATLAYASTRRIADLQAIVELLRELRARNQGDPQIGDGLAVGTVNLLDCNLKLGRYEAVESSLSELRQLAAAFPGEALLLRRLANGIQKCIAAYAQAQRAEGVERLMVELFDLYVGSKDQQTLLAHWRDTLTYYNRWRGATVPLSPILAEELAKAFASGFDELTNPQGPQLDRLDENVGEVRQFHKAHPASEMVGRCLADMLFRCVSLFGAARRTERLDPLLEELRELHLSFPNTEDVTESLAKSLYSAHVDYGEVGKAEQRSALAAELRRILAAAPRLGAHAPFDLFLRAATPT